MPQYNRKTDEVKNMGVFTTNWYLYKTYLKPNYKNPQTQNPSKTARIRGSDDAGESEPENLDAEKTQNFEELLQQAVDEGLSVLGESSKQALYFHLEKTFKMNRQDIPYRIEEFTDAVEKIFGRGARIIEIQIMKSLFKRVGFTFKHYPKRENLTFTDYVTAVKIGKDNQRNAEKKQPKLNRGQKGQKDSGRLDTLGQNRSRSNWTFRGFSVGHLH
jgi:hypothetical protein